MRSTIPDARKLGVLAARIDPDEAEKLKTTHLNKTQNRADADKGFLSVKAQLVSRNQHELQNQLLQQKTPPEDILKASNRKGYAALILGILAGLGEFGVQKWTITPFFNLSPLMLYLVAGTITIITFKSVALFISSAIQAQPENELNSQKKIFMQLGFVALLTVLLLIGISAAIRKDLPSARPGAVYDQVADSENLRQSYQSDIDSAARFYEKTSMSFFIFQLLLAVASALIGGAAYYEATTRLSVSRVHLKKFQRLKKMEDEFLRINEALAENAKLVPTFLADFNFGFAQERERIENRNSDEVLVNKEGRYFSANSFKNFIKNLPGLWTNLIFIFLLAAILFCMMSRFVFAADKIVLLDMSGSVRSKDYKGEIRDFEKNVKAIEDLILSLHPGDDLKVIGITECSFQKPYLLMDVVLSADRGAFDQNLKRQRLAILNEWDGIKKNLKPDAKETDIIGAIFLASALMKSSMQDNNIIVLSDMRHINKDLDLESPKVIDFNAAIDRIKNQGLIPQLNGLKVLCAGVTPGGSSPQYYQSLKKFWQVFFRDAGVKELIFTMERRFDYEQGSRNPIKKLFSGDK